MANQLDINAAKLALCGCTNKKQIMYIVECMAENGRYDYDYDSSVSDNAIYADMQHKHHDLAKVLRFADKQLARMK